MNDAILNALERFSQEKTLVIAAMNFSEDYPPPPPDDRFVSLTAHPFNIDMKPHVSQAMELMYVCRGVVTQNIDGQELRLSPGDILLTSPGTVHGVYPTSRNDLAVNITVSPYFFDQVDNILPGHSALSLFQENLLYQNRQQGEYLLFSSGKHLPISNLMELLCLLYFPPEGDGQGHWSEAEIERVAASCLSNIFFFLHKDLSAFQYNMPSSFDQTLRKTMRLYIENNYKTATLSELAEQLNCSKSTLSRNINRLTGHSFIQHVQMFRLEKAAEMLKNTLVPVEDIAAAVGYENYSYFYRKFHELYGCSPGHYRREVSDKKGSKRHAS